MSRLKMSKNISMMSFILGSCAIFIFFNQFLTLQNLIDNKNTLNTHSVEQTYKTQAEKELFDRNVFDGKDFQTNDDATQSVQATTVTESYNVTQIKIDNILNKIRTEIRNKLQDYDFNYSRVQQLKDLIIEAGGKPKRALIVSTWRSGSSFLGDLLNSMPGNFYYYEPFMQSKTGQIKKNQVDNAIDIIKKLYHCSYDTNKLSINMFQMGWNKLISDFGENNKKLIFDFAFFKRFCSLFPFQIMKLLRFRLRFVEELLQDKELDLKVILLVRDPRAVMQSRQHVKFCQKFEDCSEPKLVCKDMVSDYRAAALLLDIYPDRLMVIRFEDLVVDIKNNSRKLLKFLQRKEMPEIMDFIRTHTNLKNDHRFATYRVTKDIPYKWRNILGYEYVQSIQTACLEAMTLWGYKPAHNATHMRDKDFDPLEEYSIQPMTPGNS